MKIKTYGDGSARLLWDWRDIALTTANFETLRAFFQAERDEQLGRWRDPKHPDLVCYDRGDDTVYVLNERTGFTYARTRSDIIDGSDQYDFVAKCYFQAHPEPKPWHAARPDCDEIWVLTIHGCEQPVYVTEFGGEPAFQVPGGETMSLSHGAITAGHRIWPEHNGSGDES